MEDAERVCLTQTEQRDFRLQKAGDPDVCFSEPEVALFSGMVSTMTTPEPSMPSQEGRNTRE